MWKISRRNLHPYVPACSILQLPLPSLDDPGASKGSFLSIHFSGRSSKCIGDDDTDSDGDPLALDNLFQSETIRPAPPPLLQRTLYIQMEFVERQTLKEAGAGTSNVLTIAQEVGTRLYIALEVQLRKRGPVNHSKADMYSLGIVFFKINYAFSAGSERIFILERLRNRISSFQLLGILHGLDSAKHEPDQRPSAIELSQSPLMPPRMEDKYFKGALHLMAKPDSPHLQTVLSALFSNSPKPVLGFLYDQEAELPEYAS
ncbi:hypothetical protein EV360DRAFT_74490 [Lentinula raphanica]|nr:hypothetical protein EV360DRAFT_74490 [Lentinula raphanica]